MTGVVHTPTAAVALAALAFLAGCRASSNDAGGLAEGDQVRQFVRSMDGKSKFLADRFAKGSAPAAGDLAKYGKYKYRVDGNPSISGESATAKIKLLDDKDQQVGTAEWTFVKEGGQWKIKTAPLL
jgi:hypothetical protein